MGRITGILETVLYTADLEVAGRFYEQVLGLTSIFADKRMRGFDVRGGGLLIFPEGATTEPVETPFGTIPPHAGRGPMHVAFSIPAGEADAWAAHLEAHDVAIESVVDWPRGGRSLYFRDPDDHCVEIATPGLWPGY